MPHTDELEITSSQSDRRTAMSSCVNQLINQGRSREQAESECIDAADKAMGTKEANRR